MKRQPAKTRRLAKAILGAVLSDAGPHTFAEAVAAFALALSEFSEIIKENTR